MDIANLKIEIDQECAQEVAALRAQVSHMERIIIEQRALIETLSRQIDEQNERLEKIKELTI